MTLKHEHVEADGNSTGRAASRGDRRAANFVSPAPLELVRSEADRGSLTGPARAAVDVRHQIAAGQLVVRWERRHDTSIVWLGGALDRATASLLDREIDARAVRQTRLVDLTGLEFIDSSGLDSLMRIHRLARAGGDRLSFRHGRHVVNRPHELTRAVARRSRRSPRLADASDEHFYFALAMACVNVDHPRPGDRPGAA